MFLIKYLIKEPISDTNYKLFRDTDLTQLAWRHMNDNVYKTQSRVLTSTISLLGPCLEIPVLSGDASEGSFLRQSKRDLPTYEYGMSNSILYVFLLVLILLFQKLCTILYQQFYVGNLDAECITCTV